MHRNGRVLWIDVGKAWKDGAARAASVCKLTEMQTLVRHRLFSSAFKPTQSTPSMSALVFFISIHTSPKPTNDKNHLKFTSLSEMSIHNEEEKKNAKWNRSRLFFSFDALGRITIQFPFLPTTSIQMQTACLFALHACTDGNGNDSPRLSKKAIINVQRARSLYYP